MPGKTLAVVLVVLTLMCVGCGGSTPPAASLSMSGSKASFAFNDDAQSNATTGEKFAELSFVDVAGKPVDLKGYLGKKDIVLVVTRGFPGMICPYCTTQTARLMANYEEFQKRNAEVLVVFPVNVESDRDRFQQLIERAKTELKSPPAEVKFQMLIDPQLAAVKQLGIAADLAKPSTYILDKNGEIRFGYIGRNLADRPSIKAMLGQLDSLQQP